MFVDLRIIGEAPIEQIKKDSFVNHKQSLRSL